MKIKSFISKTIKLVLLLIIISCIGVYIYIKISPKLEINSANNLILYDSNNNVFFEGSQSKEWVSIDEISKNVINATISTEDKNFYKHHGFDFL